MGDGERDMDAVHDDRPLRWRIEQIDDATVVSVAGEIDLATGDEFTAAVERGLSESRPVLVVDVHEVDFFGSVGLNVLLKARESAERAGQVFRVANGSAFVERVFQVTGMDEVLTVFDSVDDALAE
jgi:anti-sigma B factor antagonist